MQAEASTKKQVAAISICCNVWCSVTSTVSSYFALPSSSFSKTLRPTFPTRFTAATATHVSLSSTWRNTSTSHPNQHGPFHCFFIFSSKVPLKRPTTRPLSGIVRRDRSACACVCACGPVALLPVPVPGKGGKQI
ncbi:unnamed protein product [Fusarium graminearum]|nr:unnamed protein product [Fusarium graminearum]